MHWPNLIRQTCIRQTCTVGELALGELDWANLHWAKDCSAAQFKFFSLFLLYITRMLGISHIQIKLIFRQVHT